MIGRSGERGSGMSVLAARHDDDDDDDDEDDDDQFNLKAKMILAHNIYSIPAYKENFVSKFSWLISKMPA